MYVYACVHVSTYTSKFIHIPAYHMHACMHACMHLYTYIYTCTCTHTICTARSRRLKQPDRCRALDGCAEKNFCFDRHGRGFTCTDSRSGCTESRGDRIVPSVLEVPESPAIGHFMLEGSQGLRISPRDLAHLELPRTPAERMVSRALLVAVLLPVCSAITWATRTLNGSPLL